LINNLRLKSFFMKDYYLYSDVELMREIKADNMLAFDGLYKKYYKKVYKFGYSLLKSQEEAEMRRNIFGKIEQNPGYTN
jgi:hypothetical protein